MPECQPSVARKKLAIIDGGLVFKWYYAIPNLLADDKTPIGAVYGFTKMLLSLIDKKYDYLVVAIDHGGQTFRHEMYPEYKNNRSAIPEDLKVQFPIVLQALAALDIPNCCMEGYEADDIIASYAIAAAKEDIEVHIVSGDKDLMQLISQNVFVYDTSSQKLLDAAHVLQKFGIMPEYIIDYLSLLGDSVDAIPGVKGIGKKSAVDLIKRFGHIEQIYENIELVASKRIKEALIADKEAAFISQNLAVLHIIPQLPNLETLKLLEFNVDKVESFNARYKMGFLSKLSHELKRKINAVAMSNKANAGVVDNKITGASDQWQQNEFLL